MQASLDHLEMITKDYRNKNNPLPKKHSVRVNNSDYQRYLIHDRIRRSLFKKNRRLNRILKKLISSNLKENQLQISELTKFINLLKIGHFDLKELLKLCDEDFRSITSKQKQDEKSSVISPKTLKAYLQSFNTRIDEAFIATRKLETKKLLEILK